MGREITAQPYCCHSPHNTAEKRIWPTFLSFDKRNSSPLSNDISFVLSKDFILLFVTQAQPKNDNAPKLHVRGDFLFSGKTQCGCSELQFFGAFAALVGRATRISK